MRVVQSFERSKGPVAVGGRTLSLVSRTRAVCAGSLGATLFHVRARPSHVEVLDEDGQRHVVAVHDMQRAITTAIAGSALAYVIGTRIARRPR